MNALQRFLGTVFLLALYSLSIGFYGKSESSFQLGKFPNSIKEVKAPVAFSANGFQLKMLDLQGQKVNECQQKKEGISFFSDLLTTDFYPSICALAWKLYTCNQLQNLIAVRKTYLFSFFHSFW